LAHSGRIVGKPYLTPIKEELPVRTKPLARRTLPRARCMPHRRFKGLRAWRMIRPRVTMSWVAN